MDQRQGEPEFYAGDSGDEDKKKQAAPEEKPSPLHRLNNVPEGEYPEPCG